MSRSVLNNNKPVFGPPRPPHLVTSLDNYVLRVELELKRKLSTPIIRTLSCPANATFHQLHCALQIAFNWATTHTYDFKVKDPSVNYDGPEDIVSMIQSLSRSAASNNSGYGPKCLLRLVEAIATQPSGLGPGFPSIDMMHDPARKNAATPQKESHEVRLHEVFEDPRYRGQEMQYEYDFGDNWEHDIKVTERRPATSGFQIVDGEGHEAAEDVGSRTGWVELIKAYNARRPSLEQKEKMIWYETMCSNGDHLGLKGDRIKVWLKDEINFSLEKDVGINGIE